MKKKKITQVFERAYINISIHLYIITCILIVDTDYFMFDFL